MSTIGPRVGSNPTAGTGVVSVHVSRSSDSANTVLPASGWWTTATVVPSPAWRTDVVPSGMETSENSGAGTSWLAGMSVIWSLAWLDCKATKPPMSATNSTQATAMNANREGADLASFWVRFAASSSDSKSAMATSADGAGEKPGSAWVFAISRWRTLPQSWLRLSRSLGAKSSSKRTSSSGVSAGLDIAALQFV